MGELLQLLAVANRTGVDRGSGGPLKALSGRGDGSKDSMVARTETMEAMPRTTRRQYTRRIPASRRHTTIATTHRQRLGYTATTRVGVRQLGKKRGARGNPRGSMRKRPMRKKSIKTGSGRGDPGVAIAIKDSGVMTSMSMGGREEMGIRGSGMVGRVGTDKRGETGSKATRAAQGSSSMEKGEKWGRTGKGQVCGRSI
jgi:hypothetical protein